MDVVNRGGAKRNYGLELYKVLCMLFVVAFHFSDHGNIKLSCNQEITFNWRFLASARIFGNLCNFGFMLISGYFLYKKKFEIKKIFKLWLQVWFYSVTLGIVCFVIGTEAFSWKSLIKMLFPFTFNQYWFFSTYIVVYFFFPYLNKLIDSLTKKQYQGLIAVSIGIFSVLCTFAHASWLRGANSIPIFIVLYFIGAYFRKYEISMPKRKTIPLAVATIIIEIASLFVTRIVCRYIGKDKLVYFVSGYSILPIATSIILFLLFKEIKIKHIKLVSFLSSSVFGVYLFHIGRLQIFLFQQLFDNSVTYETGLFVPQMILAMCSVFGVGIFIDKIRKQIFEKPVLKCIEPILDSWNEKVKKYYPESGTE